MKATIRDLGNKYYGTEVEIDLGQDRKDTVVIWVMGDYEPSEREIKLARETLDMPTEPTEVVKAEWLCDGHYESRLGYTLAKYLADGINEGRI